MHREPGPHARSGSRDPEWAEYRRLLAAGPAGIAGLIRSLPRRLWSCSDAPGRWTIHQIAAHLVHTETESWVPRILHIHDGAAGSLPRVDAQRQLERYAALPMAELLSRHGGLRQGNLARLDALQLDAERLGRTGVHPDRGPVQLRHLIATWCMHDLDHLDQISRVAGVCCAGQVGPLAAYLRICRPPA